MSPFQPDKSDSSAVHHKITENNDSNSTYQKTDVTLGESGSNESNIECSQEEMLAINDKSISKSYLCNEYSGQVLECDKNDLHVTRTVKNVSISSVLSNDSVTIQNYLKKETKVVVQTLPSFDFSSTSALEPYNNAQNKYSTLCDNFKSFHKLNLCEYQSEISERNQNLQLNNFPEKLLSRKIGASYSTVTESKPSRYAFKRFHWRSHSLNFHIRPGKGIKLRNIAHVASEVNEASAGILRVFHYILFGTYGRCKNEHLFSQTVRNILNFSGFPFGTDTEIFEKKRKGLLRVPYPILMGIYDILIGKGQKARFDVVEDLLEFLMKPTSNVHLESKTEVENNTSELLLRGRSSTNEFSIIDFSPVVLLKRLSPVVVLKRLSEEFIAKMTNKVGYNDKSSVIDKSRNYKDKAIFYHKPTFIGTGPRPKLKAFPHVVENVYKVRRNIIDLLHCVLRGRPGACLQDQEVRQNVLEFSGFTYLRKDAYARRCRMLSSLSCDQLRQICEIFALPMRGSKNFKVRTILRYLRAPYKSSKDKVRQRRRVLHPKQGEEQSLIKLKESKSNELKLNEMDSMVKLQNFDSSSYKLNGVLPMVKLQDSDNSELKLNAVQPMVKLRDFDNICFNIECATPEDLSELNDILFVKPCDNSEIHQKVLEFSPFTFDQSSFDYHYRRTLMHYMSFDAIKKIARMLSIPGWEDYSSQEDLVTTTLKFLMEMKLPSKSDGEKKPVQCHEEKSRPLILKLCKYKVQKNWTFGNSFEHTNASTDGHLFPQLSKEVLHDQVDSPFVTEHKKTVFIESYSESMCSWNDKQGKNGFSRTSNCDIEDSLSLSSFLHHPTDEELGQLIYNIIKENLWSITMGELVKEVLQHYKDFNLNYRVDFIKSRALKILSELRRNAMDLLTLSSDEPC